MSMSVDERSDGTRFNWTNLGSRYASCEMIIYLRHGCGSINDEISGKQGGGRHSDGSSPKCYDTGVDSENGATRLRSEDRHPEYDIISNGPGDATASGVGLAGSWVGYDFIKRNMSNYVLIQVWQDPGNNEGASPANQWRCIGSWNVSDPYWPNPPSDHQETVRVDNVDCLDYKWPSLREILGNDTTTPGTGGVGGGVGGGTGGIGGGTGTGQVPGGQIPSGQVSPNGAFDQMGNFVGPGNGTYDQYGNYVGYGYGSGSYGGGGSTGTGSGGTGTGIDTPSGQETQIVYERKEFFMRWNINFYSGDACGVGKSPEERPVRAIYKVDGDVYAEGKNYRRFGIYIANESKTDAMKNSMFIDTIARYVQFTAKKQGVSSLPGNINLRIRDIDYNIVSELGSIAASVVTASDQNLFVNVPNNTRKFKKGDHISIEYDGSTQDNFLRVKVSQKDKIDLNNTILFVWDGNAYIYDPFADMGGVVSI